MVLYEDGCRIVTESHTIDGKWDIESRPSVQKKRVVAWRSFDTPYEGH